MIKIILILLFFIGNINAYTLYFDGTDDLIINTESKLDWLDYDVPFTICAWVYPYNAITKQNGIITKNPDGGWANKGFAFEVSWGELNFYAGSDNSNKYRATTDNDYLVNNRWQHVAVVHEGNALVTGNTFYYNGTQSTTVIGTAGTLTSTIKNNSPLHLGRTYGESAAEAFGGSIKDVRIFDKALVANEILQIMQDIPSQATENSRLRLGNGWMLDSATYITDLSGDFAVISGTNIVGVSISTISLPTTPLK